jgi:hypothetical protein
MIIVHTAPIIKEAVAKKSEKEEDLDNLKEEKKLLAEAKTGEKKLENTLRDLERAQASGTDPGNGLTGDCGISCGPSSISGGNCPDALFVRSGISFAAPIKANTTTNTLQGCENVTWQTVQVAFPDNGSQSLCMRVKKAMDANPSLAGISNCGYDCVAAVNQCKYVKLPKEIERIKEEIKDRKKDISELDTSISELKKDTENGCADCGAAYSQREPTKAESTAMVLGSIFPYFSTGMSGYLQASGQNKYYSAYNNYLSSCTTIGVPCNGPSYAGGGSSGMGGGMSSGMMMGGYSSTYGGGSMMGGYSSMYGGGSMMGSSMYGGSMMGGYSSMYGGGSMMGSSMYGGSMMGGYSSTYGGGSMMGSSMYGGSMMGGYSSMYGGGSMMGSSMYGGMMGGYSSMSGGIVSGMSGGVYVGTGGYPLFGGSGYGGGYGMSGGGSYVGGGGVYAGTSYTGGIAGASAYSGLYGGSTYSGLYGGYGGSIYSSGISGSSSYTGYNPYSQYSSLYSQSLSNQMLGMQRSASDQPDFFVPPTMLTFS